MARRDIMTANGARLEVLNIDQPVGKNQPNDRMDVKLIQAMFWTLAKWDINGLRVLGPQSWTEVPDPRTGNGNFEDGRTEKAIWIYQRKYAHRLLRVDGIIHPAMYQNRNIEGLFNDIRLMTITLLHDMLLANLPGAPVGVSSYIEGIKRIAPDLPI
jgi:hypothetical protein